MNDGGFLYDYPDGNLLFDLFKVDVFSHGVPGRRRIGSFRGGSRSALLGIGVPEGIVRLIVRVLHIFLHISKLLTYMFGGPEYGQEQIKNEFVKEV